MLISCYVSIPQWQERFWLRADTFWQRLLDIRLRYSVRSQSRFILSCSRLFSYEAETEWRSIFRKVRQCIQQACSTFEMEPRQPVKHHQVSSDRRTTCSAGKAIHLATKSPALNSTPPPPNYKSIKLWYILILFSPPSNSLSSSSLFSTFTLFISITIINIYSFISPSNLSSFHFFPLLFLFTPLSSVLSSLPSSQISIFIIKISFSYSFCL